MPRRRARNSPMALPDTVSSLIGSLPSRQVHWRRPLWRVELPAGGAAVVRAYPSYRARGDVQWEYQLLADLAKTFPVPRPVDLFNGESTAVLRGEVWGALEYLPGRPLGWSKNIGPHALGKFIADFHVSTSTFRASPGPRPFLPSLDELPGAVPWGVLRSELDADSFSAYSRILELVLEGMPSRARQRRILIHGDIVPSNVIVRRGKCYGLIDFDHAQEAEAEAEIGFCLWQAARPALTAVHLQPSRIEQIVTGYMSAGTVSGDSASLISTYILARGVQLIARWARLGSASLGPAIARLRAVEADYLMIRSAVSAGCVIGNRS